MTTMMASATITDAYIMKPPRATKSRLRSSPIDKSDTRPRHINIRLIDMSNTEEPREREREFRSRRAHRKSRLGCMRCKQARRKCDEAKPRCSRCTARDADCNYPENSSTSPHVEDFLDLPNELDDDFWDQFQPFSIPTPSMPTNTGAGASLSSAASSVPSPFPISQNFTIADFDSSLPGQALNARESELLSHYLSHTARAFAYDTDDLYALQIGFPSLAFRSELIMKSMLALAAVCNCHDLLRKRSERIHRRGGVIPDGYDLQEIRELLALAEQYHSQSLSQTQAEMTGVSSYEFALANAPLMVQYGLASQNIRIQLAEQQVAGGNSPSEFTLAHSQWISLIRAAREARIGFSMAVSHEESSQAGLFTSGQRLASSPHPLGSGSTPDATVIAYDGRSTKNSKHLLLPIVSATCHNAFDIVRNRAMAMQLAASTQSSFVTQAASFEEQSQIQACLTALDTLVDIASKVCGHGPSVTGSPMQTTPTAQHQQPLALPTWLQDYLARVTSASPSQASHRTITAFVNRVPAAFMNMVQEVLAMLPTETGVTGLLQETPRLSTTQKLAMDVMAHWLVFLMLLDDIWWIGEIGCWELRRVRAVMKAVGWADGDGEQWWPESMHRIRAEVEKHRY